MKRDRPFWLMVAASAFGLVAVAIAVVGGFGGSSLPAALGAVVVLVVGWTAVAARARQGRQDDRGAAGPVVPGPPARLVLSRGDDSAGMLRRIRVTVDGEPAALLKPRAVAEVDVPPGRHRVRASMDWTTSPALDLDLVPGERVEVRAGLPSSMIWRMVIAPGNTLTIERVGHKGVTEHDGRRSFVLAASWAGLFAFCAAGVVLSAVTQQQGWATVSVTATAIVLVTRAVDRLTERGRRVLDVVAVVLFAAVLAGVVVLLAVTDGFADAWYLVVLAAVLLAGVVGGVRVRRRREADAPPRIDVVRRARAGKHNPLD